MVIIANRLSFIPIRLATSRSSAVERMARPNRVFINRNQRRRQHHQDHDEGQQLLIEDLDPADDKISLNQG